MLVIGFGSGRSGTASLSRLLNAQPASLCFHELNPACMKYEGTPAPVRTTIREFRAILDGGDPRDLTVDFSRRASEKRYEELLGMPRVEMLGDIAHYYLRYLDDIYAVDPNVRFICLKRDRASTIDSWIRKCTITRWPSKWIADQLSSLITRQPYYRTTNMWLQHDGSVYARDPIWDKCFPKYDAVDMRSAIALYYDDYYERVELLRQKYPDNLRLVATESLNTEQGQRDALDFIGYPRNTRVQVDAHIHKSTA